MQVERTYSNYNTPFFTSYKSALSKKFENVISGQMVSKEDVVELTKSMDEFIKSNRNLSINLVGEGSHAMVFRLDDDYVVKVPVGRDIFGDFKLVTGIFSDLKSYYGEEIATFGKVKVLKNVSKSKEHNPVGLPYKSVFHLSSSEATKYYEDVCFPRIANLPQKSFDNLAQDCAILNEKKGYLFDYMNPNNFVLVDNEIRVVDSIVCSIGNDSNSITNLLRPFLWSEGVYKEASFSEKLLEPRREVFKKIVLAGMKHDLPVLGMGREYVFDEVTEWLCRANTPSQKISKRLEQIKNDYHNISERLEQTKIYLETIFDKS